MKYTNLKIKAGLAQISEEEALEIESDLIFNLTGGRVDVGLDKEGCCILVDPHTGRDITESVEEIVSEYTENPRAFIDFYNL